MFYIFQLFLSSAALFTYKHIHIYRAVESQAFAISASFEANINAFRMFLIFFIHICLTTNSLTFPPSPCPLVSVNVINHSSLSAHVLHIPTLFILCSSFYLFICTQTFSFTNILHSYLLNNQLIFSPVFLPSSLPLTLLLSPSPSLFSATFSPTFNLFLYLYLSLSRCLFDSRPLSILVSFASCSSTPSPLAFPLSSSLSLLPVSVSLFSPSLSPPFLPLHLSISLSSPTSSISLYLSLPLPLSVSDSSFLLFLSFIFLSLPFSFSLLLFLFPSLTLPHSDT